MFLLSVCFFNDEVDFAIKDNKNFSVIEIYKKIGFFENKAVEIKTKK